MYVYTYIYEKFKNKVFGFLLLSFAKKVFLTKINMNFYTNIFITHRLAFTMSLMNIQITASFMTVLNAYENTKFDKRN